MPSDASSTSEFRATNRRILLWRYVLVSAFVYMCLTALLAATLVHMFRGYSPRLGIVGDLVTLAIEAIGACVPGWWFTTRHGRAPLRSEQWRFALYAIVVENVLVLATFVASFALMRELGLQISWVTAFKELGRSITQIENVAEITARTVASYFVYALGFGWLIRKMAGHGW